MSPDTLVRQGKPVRQELPAQQAQLAKPAKQAKLDQPVKPGKLDPVAILVTLGQQGKPATLVEPGKLAQPDLQEQPA